MVAIVTLNYNQNDYTINCIESILRSNYYDYKIILIDNGSTVNNFLHLKESLPADRRIKLVRNERNLGYVGGINTGFKESSKLSPDYYIIMNNDTVIDKNALSELVFAAKRYNNTAIIAGKVLHMDDSDYIQQTGTIFTDNRYLSGYSPGKNELDIGQCDKEEERDSLDDILWIIPANIVDDIGYYCNYYFMYAEQGDYAQNARRRGYKMIYAPKVKIWHKGSATSGGGNRQALPVLYWRGKSSFIFSFRNLKFRYFIVKNMILLIKLLAKMMLNSGENKKQAIARFRGFTAGILWLIKRNPDNGFNPYVK